MFEKMWEAFALQKLLTFFNKKYWHILDINFNDKLTNDVVSFEQPGPVVPSNLLMWSPLLRDHLS